LKRRRRRKGLGSSAGAHERAAQESAGHLIRYTHNAEKQLAQGACAIAARSIVAGAIALGRLQAEARAMGGSTRWIDPAVAAYGRVEDNVLARCVKGSRGSR
jgi:hypothetical protein